MRDADQIPAPAWPAAKSKGHGRRLLASLRRSEVAPGIVLILSAAVAIVAANSGLEHAYHDLLHAPLAWTPVSRLATAHLWINDGLMALFFFVVGLEIKREIVTGALSNPQTRRLPVIAAAAGMAAPALVYLAVTRGEPPLAAGWAIPAATDIAFAMGVLALLGPRIPATLRLFLLTVAVVDDIGAVAIIALFYTAAIDLGWLGAAGIMVVALVGLNRARVTALPAYLLLAAGLWYAVLHSGIHATVAGVVAALTVPLALDRGHDSPLLRLEHALVPWNGFLIVPLFGFANAGVALTHGSASEAGALPWAIAAGLFLGKQAGIFGCLYAAVRLGLADRPANTSWPQLWGMSLLCGIGFTMSLFIAGLAFPGQAELVDQAKLGILAGSLLSALAGYCVLRLAPGVPDTGPRKGNAPAAPKAG